jgi:hypothetical protein
VAGNSKMSSRDGSGAEDVMLMVFGWSKQGLILVCVFADERREHGHKNDS